jgi:hypothetical protein
MHKSCNFDSNKIVSVPVSRMHNANIYFKMAIVVFETKFVYLLKGIIQIMKKVYTSTNFALNF